MEKSDTAIDHPDKPTLRRPLRLWPGVVLALLMGLFRFGVPLIWPDAMAIPVMGALLCGLCIVLWWAFLSRAPRIERWGAVVLIIVSLVATRSLLHESIATGMMGLMFAIYAIPFLSLALVIWAVAARHLVGGPRRATLVATILIACGGWTLVKTGGFTGDGNSDFSWRWADTPEDRLLAEDGDEPQSLASGQLAIETEVLWPGFRGLDRNSVIRGLAIETDWTASPPMELWRRPIGPGWSSFAVMGDLVFTQEQRGDEEVVACYRVKTGAPVWKHRDPARFWESNGGAGPRGTPTLDFGRVYSFGGTGILNALDANNGAVVWARNAAADAKVEVPIWGFSSSPLVLHETVVVAVAGTLVAYDLSTGDPRWFGADGGMSYSSPHLATIDGVQQVVLMSASGATAVDALDGTMLWEHPWKGYPIVQPALTEDGDLLIAANEKSGLRRLAIAQESDGWAVEEQWTSIGLKPYFNDFVLHDGHAFGFDGRILSCIDLETGDRQWKGGRYGNGQLVLLADQDLLLILSVRGELALVRATPDQFTELARFPAIEGKTWNHPVLVGDLLLVRNGQEMVAFRLTLADSAVPAGA
jgi:outer membrane protein assembly factor BamB